MSELVADPSPGHAGGPAGSPTAPDKGLRGGALSMVSNVVIGLSSTRRPTRSRPPWAARAGRTGFKAVAFVLLRHPDLFVSAAMRELNSVEHDCGTIFTWTVRAFGSRTGWMTAGCHRGQLLVMTSQSAIPGATRCCCSGWTRWPTTRCHHRRRRAVDDRAVLLCYRGIEISARVQWVLLGVELSILAVFSVWRWSGVHRHGRPAGDPGELGLVLAVRGGLARSSPRRCSRCSSTGLGELVSVNEESADPGTGRARPRAVTVLLVATTADHHCGGVLAGVGDTGIGLANEANSDDVLAGWGTRCSAAARGAGVRHAAGHLRAHQRRGQQPGDHHAGRPDHAVHGAPRRAAQGVRPVSPRYCPVGVHLGIRRRRDGAYLGMTALSENVLSTR